MHIYQRTIEGHLIFYDLEDFLVFYTIFSIVSRYYNITILELCLMVDHIHILISSTSMRQISLFIQHYTSLFVREYNHGIHRTGSFFKKSFGSAPKKNGKKIRSTIVYIGNNPVEKGLCKNAEDYKWNFLSYMKKGADNIKRVSRKLERRLKEIKQSKERLNYLNYIQLRRMLKGLSSSERETLTDFIIRIYFPFDSHALLSYYDSYEDMLIAMKSSSGNEYDIRETYNPGSDTIYRDMISEIHKEFPDMPVRKITVLPDENKIQIGQMLMKRTGASAFQIGKFLHLNITSPASEHHRTNQPKP